MFVANETYRTKHLY